MRQNDVIIEGPTQIDNSKYGSFINTKYWTRLRLYKAL